MREICPYSLLQGEAVQENSEYLSRLVCEESVRRPHDNFIVVVPEQYTMETPKKTGAYAFTQGNFKY